MLHRDKKIAGMLLASVNEEYFASDQSKTIYKAIRAHMSESGESPTFRNIMEDPSIDRDARDHLRDSTVSITTTEEAASTLRVLNKYRQLRGVYELGLSIQRTLDDGSIRMDTLLDDLSLKLSQVRTSQTVKDSFMHFGKNNSSMEFVKDLIFNPDNDDVIPSGIPEFDAESGGFLRGSLVTLGGSSGGGKCGILDTRIQLSTLIIETDEFTMECEPEDTVVLTSGEIKQAEYLCAGDDIETCPEITLKLLADFQKCT
jgi:replicative DNA helicase